MLIVSDVHLEEKEYDIKQEIGKVLRSHLKDQPYKSTCTKCGNAVECFTQVDSDYDMTLHITPCECVDK